MSDPWILQATVGGVRKALATSDGRRIAVSVDVLAQDDFATTATPGPLAPGWIDLGRTHPVYFDPLTVRDGALVLDYTPSEAAPDGGTEQVDPPWPTPHLRNQGPMMAAHMAAYQALDPLQLGGRSGDGHGYEVGVWWELPETSGSYTTGTGDSSMHLAHQVGPATHMAGPVVAPNLDPKTPQAEPDDVLRIGLSNVFDVSLSPIFYCIPVFSSQKKFIFQQRFYPIYDLGSPLEAMIDGNPFGPRVFVSIRVFDGRMEGRVNGNRVWGPIRVPGWAAQRSGCGVHVIDIEPKYRYFNQPPPPAETLPIPADPYDDVTLNPDGSVMKDDTRAMASSWMVRRIDQSLGDYPPVAEVVTFPPVSADSTTLPPITVPPAIGVGTPLTLVVAATDIRTLSVDVPTNPFGNHLGILGNPSGHPRYPLSPSETEPHELQIQAFSIKTDVVPTQITVTTDGPVGPNPALVAFLCTATGVPPGSGVSFGPYAKDEDGTGASTTPTAPALIYGPLRRTLWLAAARTSAAITPPPNFHPAVSTATTRLSLHLATGRMGSGFVYEDGIDYEDTTDGQITPVVPTITAPTPVIGGLGASARWLCVATAVRQDPS